MLDKLKPAWKVYKCQQGLEAIQMDELVGLLDEAEYKSGIFSKQWSIALLALVMMVTCCYGG